MGKVFFHLDTRYCTKGSTLIEYNDKLLKDDGKGSLLEGDIKVGSINYKTGIISITVKSNTNFFNSLSRQQNK